MNATGVRGAPLNAARLSRGQLIAGAALVGLIGCGEDEDSTFREEPRSSSSSSGAGNPIYGAPCLPSECFDAGRGDAEPEEDAGGSSSGSLDAGDTDGGSSSGNLEDAGSSSGDDGGSSGVAPPYGLPPTPQR